MPCETADPCMIQRCSPPPAPAGTMDRGVMNKHKVLLLNTFVTSLLILCYIELGSENLGSQRRSGASGKVTKTISCPRPGTTIITFQKVGRLGNQLASYVNMLMMERCYNLTPFLPPPTRHWDLTRSLQSFLENVTMPVWEKAMSTSCRVQVRAANEGSRRFHNYLLRPPPN